ncbi:hypothetical protein P886_1756 [Alteromonadaceae bacterium 2753L.S.0a.02]|nr:hypothetical protein P886_1756 [Alteromonadaceae bacterium 2753L.S.0a.02]
MKYLLFIILLLAKVTNACGLSDARVVGTHRYHDGYIFVNFDKPTSCDCSQNARLAFRDDGANMDYVKSMILIAYSSQVPVSATANGDSCTVHGNTAVLTAFYLNKQQ